MLILLKLLKMLGRCLIKMIYGWNDVLKVSVIFFTLRMLEIGIRKACSGIKFWYEHYGGDV